MERYPLSWPVGWPRTPSKERRAALFGKAPRAINPLQRSHQRRAISISEGLERVLHELRHFGVSDDVVVSTNVPRRLDGMPHSNLPEPGDPGVAVYWRIAKTTKVMAIDVYDRVADNLGAIAASLSAMRAIERHGGALVLDRAFSGFEALPAPARKRAWWEVLGCTPTSDLDQVRGCYRTLVSARHPDRGGSHEAMSEINRAWEQAQREVTA